ncbi:MAG: sterol desaturase family protein [Pseudomonadales bacterium]
MSLLDQNESAIRLAVFAGVFATMAILEAVAPRKERTMPRAHRWLTNTALVFVNSMLLRITFPILAVGMAELALTKGWGILSLVALPFWLEVVIAVMILDMLVYIQHVAFHKLPLLWIFHKVHHADRDFDVTTGVRFHPIEIVISMAYKLLGIALLGPPVVGVFIFELLLNASAMFNHANFRLPQYLDRVFRKVIVTPDFHRIHHSIIRSETDSNYGFFLSVWDHLFRSYQSQPSEGHDGMTIGLPEYQTQKPASLMWSLWLPFIPSSFRRADTLKE